MEQRILIAAENSALRDRLSAIITTFAQATEQQINVTAVSSGIIAQYQLSRSKFNLAIIAFQPSDSIQHVLYHLHEIYPELPILILYDPNTTDQIDLPVGEHISSFDILETDIGLQRAIAHRLGVGWSISLREESKHLVRDHIRSLEHTSGVDCVVIADQSGLPMAFWSAHTQINTTEIAHLAASALAATTEMNHQLGGSTQGALIIKELGEQMVLIARVGADLVALMVLNKRAPLGWGRLVIKRLVKELEFDKKPLQSGQYVAC